MDAGLISCCQCDPMGDSVLCYAGKAHIICSPVYPEGGGSKSLYDMWYVVPCDKSCLSPQREVPAQLVGQLLGFLRDGKSRSGRFE